MSALELPRLHFRGVARLHAPTGDRNALPIFDLATHRVFQGGVPAPADAPAEAFQAWLRRAAACDRAGRDDPVGPFSRAAGFDLGGNGHFSWDARITAVQLAAGVRVADDPLIGRSIDLWGHHNPYLGTTFNRARLVLADPTSPWTAQIHAGRLTLGRRGPSIDDGNLVSGDVEGPAPARWMRRDFLRDLPPHWLGSERAAASRYQLVLPRAGLTWLPGADASPGLRALAAAVLADDDADGLVVRFALFNLCAGEVADGPGFADVVGTVGVHRVGEMRTAPAGRWLAPCPGAGERLGPIAALITHDRVTLDLALAVPRIGRAPAPAPGAQTCELGPARDLGPLALRLGSGELVARVPYELYADPWSTAGIVDLPPPPPGVRERVADEPLVLVAEADGAPLLREREIVVETDDANLVIEPGEPEDPDDPAAPATTLVLRSFRRGRPAAASGVHLHAFYNPHAVPGWRHDAPDPARYRYPRSDEVAIVGLRSSADAPFAATCECATDGQGRGEVQIVGLRSGACRVWISGERERYAPPLARDADDEPQRSFDRDDHLGHWGAAGSFNVRVLPDDRDLDAIPDEAVDYPLLYRAVLRHYDLLYPFMADEVFGLGDRGKVATYARLIWQMSAPESASKTYYMPSTRDLSRRRARLLRAYLRNVEPVAAIADDAPPSAPALTGRDALVDALRRAVEIEQLVMLQYLFAAYSIPNHETGRRLVERGRWTAAQLRLACGDGEEGLDQGIRGVLLTIAHEEMIHFLAVNNVLRALGEPFHAPPPIFGPGRRLGLGVDLSLAPFSRERLHALIRLESPPAGGDGSIAALYRQIRGALAATPGAIVAPGGGGEHHLFLSERCDRVHPDYQLEVVDVRSALFAIDLITGQGEGAPHGVVPGADGHFARLRGIAAAIARSDAEAPPHAPLWEPAYPVLTGPTRDPSRPGAALVTDPIAREVMALVDESYAIVLRLMALHFHATPRASLRRSRVMNAAIDVMTGILRPLATLAMSLPSGAPGPTAGPGFEVGEVAPPASSAAETLAAIAADLTALGARARACPPVPPAARELFVACADALARLAVRAPR